MALVQEGVNTFRWKGELGLFLIVAVNGDRGQQTALLKPRHQSHDVVLLDYITKDLVLIIKIKGRPSCASSSSTIVAFSSSLPSCCWLGDPGLAPVKHEDIHHQ